MARQSYRLCEMGLLGSLECELQSIGLSSEHGVFPITTVLLSLESSNVSHKLPCECQGPSKVLLSTDV